MVQRYSSTVPLIGLTFFIVTACLFLLSDTHSNLKLYDNTSSSVLGAHVLINNQQNLDKTVVDCEFFGKLTAKTLFPSFFPSAPQNSQYCGSDNNLQASYFTTTLLVQQILSYYKQALQSKNCFVTNATATSLSYTCSRGNGTVRTYTTIAAYSITYHPQ